MKGILAIVTTFCFVNLVPYLLTILLLLLPNGSRVYTIITAIKSLLEIPSSLIWFLIQKDLGDFWWITFNILGVVVSVYLIKEL